MTLAVAGRCEGIIVPKPVITAHPYPLSHLNTANEAAQAQG